MGRRVNTDASRAFAPYLGAAMKAARKRAGLKNAIIEQDIGVTQQAISHWETGRVLPTLSMFMAYCERCGVAMWEVFEVAERRQLLVRAQDRLRRQMEEDRARQRRAYSEEGGD